MTTMKFQKQCLCLTEANYPGTLHPGKEKTMYGNSVVQLPIMHMGASQVQIHMNQQQMHIQQQQMMQKMRLEPQGQGSSVSQVQAQPVSMGLHGTRRSTGTPIRAPGQYM